jgi:hypothetical protein
MSTNAPSPQPEITLPGDYPAAHSMDSTWWAVDGQGHVAKFETHEAGAMPSQCQNLDVYEMFSRLLSAGFGGLTFAAGDLLAEADAKLYVRYPSGPWNDVVLRAPSPKANFSSFHGLLVWLHDEATLASLLLGPAATGTVPKRLKKRIAQLFGRPSSEGPQIHRLPSPDKIVIWITKGSADENPDLVAFINDLLGRGMAARGWVCYQPPEVERFGFFAYSHDTFDNGSSGPYERAAPPLRPAHIDDLPPAVSHALANCRLEQVDFMGEVLIQPLEHFSECNSRAGNWISTTGQLAPVRDAPDAVPGPDAQPAEAISGEVASQSSLGPLVEAWLSCKLGADDVLNDYLQEAGHKKLPALEGPAARLDTALVRFLTPAELLAVEADFVDHVLGQADLAPNEFATLSAAIDAARRFARDDLSRADLATAADSAWQQWQTTEAESEQTNRVAWAAWTLARRWPLVAARTVRSLRPGELHWQIEYVVRLLDSRWRGVP